MGTLVRLYLGTYWYVRLYLGIEVPWALQYDCDSYQNLLVDGFCCDGITCKGYLHCSQGATLENLAPCLTIGK